MPTNPGPMGVGAQNLEATTGIEPVYAVLQSPPERAPTSVSVRDSCSIDGRCGAPFAGVASIRCYQSGGVML